MRMLVPAVIDASKITSTNVSEDDFAEWDNGTAYTTGDRVIKAAEHLVYEALTDHTGTDPTGDVDSATGIGTNWIRVGATNRHKPFDGFIAQAASQANEIRYTLTPGELCDGLALFGVDAAEVQLIVTDPQEGEVYNETKSLISDVNIVDWYAWFFSPLQLDEEILFADLPPYPDASFEVIVTNPGGTVEIGQIILGQDYQLGTTTTKTSLSTEDFSTFERDTFGRVSNIVERPYIRIIDFDFAIVTDNTRFIERLISAQRAKAAVYYTDPEKQGLGTLVFGKARPLSVNLVSSNTSYATLEVEGFI